MTEEANENNPEKIKNQINLSKSWKIKEINSTLYTGGKILLSNGKNSLAKEDEEASLFIAALCNGKVSLIDFKSGIKLYDLHNGLFIPNDTTLIDNQGTDEEDEEEAIDENSIISFTLSYNDKYVTTVSHNYLLRVYNLQTQTSHIIGKEITTNNYISCVEYHNPSNVYLATGNLDGIVSIWDVRNEKDGYMTHSYNTTSSGSAAIGSISCIRWLPSNTNLILGVGRENGGISLYDLKKKKKGISLDGHVSTVTCMEWLATNAKNEYLVVSGSRDQVIFLWKVSLYTKKNELDIKTTKILTCPLYEQIESIVLFSTSANSWDCYTGGSNGIIKQWEITYGTKVSMDCKIVQPQKDQYGSENGGYLSILSLPNQQGMLMVDAEYNIHTMTNNLQSKASVIIGNWDEIFDIKLFTNNNKQYVAIATNSTNIYIQDKESNEIYIVKGHDGLVLAIDISPCGNYIISCSKDRTVRLWKVCAGDDMKVSCVGVGKGHTEAIGATAICKKSNKYVSGNAFAISASKDKTLKKWDITPCIDTTTMTEMDVMTSVKAHDKDINIISIAPNDSLIATGSQDKTIKIWDSDNLTIKGSCVGHKRGIWDCQFSPIDRIIVSSSGDKTIKLWSLKDFSCIRTFQGHAESVLRVRFLTAGLQLISSGSDGLIKLWTIRTNECEATLDHHTDKIWALDYSNDTLVSGGGDSQLVFWKDITVQKQEEELVKREEYIILEQRLSNYLYLKQYEKAFNLGLHMDKPNMVLKVLNTLLSKEGDNEDITKSNIQNILQTHIKTLPQDKIIQLLKYVRDWNTHARNATIAMIVLRAIIMSLPFFDKSFIQNKEIVDVVAGIIPYMERHLERLEKLYMDSFILDYFVCVMTDGMIGEDLEEDVDGGGDEYEHWVVGRKLVAPDGGKDVMDVEDDTIVTIGESSSSSSDDDEQSIDSHSSSSSD